MASKPFHYAISTYMMLDAAATITSYCGLHAPLMNYEGGIHPGFCTDNPICEVWF